MYYVCGWNFISLFATNNYLKKNVDCLVIEMIVWLFRVYIILNITNINVYILGENTILVSTFLGYCQFGLYYL